MVLNGLDRPSGPAEVPASADFRGARVRARARRRRHLSSKTVFVWSTLLPVLAFYAGWLYFPIVYSLIMSLYNWNPLSSAPQQFLGASNYIEAFTRDPVFWVALSNSVWYTVKVVPSGVIVALVLALLLNSVRHFATFFRTAYFLPVVTSIVAAAIMWNWLYQPQFGLINNVLRLIDDTFGLDLPTQTAWLGDPSLAMNSVVAFDVWKGAGFGMVIFLAGLQGIPSTLYEAARVDGANRWQLFWRVTLPLLQPTVLLVLVVSMIGALQAFGQFFVLTHGGPANATLTMTYLLYGEAFSANRFGYASALATILFVIILGISLLQLRLLRLRWEY